jgi:hydroxymethylbilane synthase
VRIGTRGSPLALAQAQTVAGAIEGAEIVVLRTSGDRDGGTQLPAPATAKERGGTRTQEQSGDKSRWVDTIEAALLDGTIDLAVHSAKDVPGEIADGLTLVGSTARARAEDALIGVSSLEELPEGARVGTSSLRRGAQLQAARADLKVESMRGNVDTRLRKLHESVGKSAATHGSRDHGERPLAAIVLARAGLHRLGREDEMGGVLDPARFVPAPGQGTLALQARTADEAVREAIAPILDPDAFACLTAERALARALGASCNTPLGAHATPAGCGCLVLRAWVGLPDGSQWVRDELIGGFYEPTQLGERVAERMRAAGAGELLARAEKLAGAPPAHSPSSSTCRGAGNGTEIEP